MPHRNTVNQAFHVRLPRLFYFRWRSIRHAKGRRNAVGRDFATRGRKLGPPRNEQNITMNLMLNGRVAVITGPAKGMGSAITRAFAEEGCRLALLARDLDAVEPLAGELRSAGH